MYVINLRTFGPKSPPLSSPIHFAAELLSLNMIYICSAWIFLPAVLTYGCISIGRTNETIKMIHMLQYNQPVVSETVKVSDPRQNAVTPH